MPDEHWSTSTNCVEIIINNDKYVHGRNRRRNRAMEARFSVGAPLLDLDTVFFLFFSFFFFFFSSHLTWKRLTLKSVANDGWNIPSAAAVSGLLLLLMSTRISVQPIDMVSCIGNSISCCNIHLLLSNIGLLCGIQWYSKAVALMPRTLSIYHPSMAIPLVIIQIYPDISRSQNMVGKFFFLSSPSGFINSLSLAIYQMQLWCWFLMLG